MPVQAKGNIVIVQEIDTRQATYGLIQVNRNEPAILVSGRVLSKGPKVQLDCKVGDRVWFKRQYGWELPDKQLALKAEHIDCVCEDELEAMHNWYDKP